eukprot:CAMPEP_0170322474 /NCGR_PEP_ID=MMETSP0116_2-20130129/62022_1 /TAXON_ID=400756 /ORGANISM="Durinskia baltica, Strain CSIRO CS-38" /LENGTH=50 /DNA_ID=CAMNT_0010575347 /DNA_START=1 /DNA_END=150 /DNA_ORIENTATION=-
MQSLANGSKQELALAIEAVDAPVFAVDREGNVTEWNQIIARMSGWKREHA